MLPKSDFCQTDTVIFQSTLQDRHSGQWYSMPHGLSEATAGARLLLGTTQSYCRYKWTRSVEPWGRQCFSSGRQHFLCGRKVRSLRIWSRGPESLIVPHPFASCWSSRLLNRNQKIKQLKNCFRCLLRSSLPSPVLTPSNYFPVRGLWAAAAPGLNASTLEQNTQHQSCGPSESWSQALRLLSTFGYFFWTCVGGRDPSEIIQYLFRFLGWKPFYS